MPRSVNAIIRWAFQLLMIIKTLSYSHGKIQKFSLRQMQTIALNFELIDKVKQGAQVPWES